MNLNLGKFLYQNNKSNHFKAKYKENIEIAQTFKTQLLPLLEHNSKVISKTFYPKIGLWTPESIIVGDDGGYVLKIDQNSVCKELYYHKMSINDLKLRKDNKTIISASEDTFIKFYDLEGE